MNDIPPHKKYSPDNSGLYFLSGYPTPAEWQGKPRRGGNFNRSCPKDL